MAKTNYRSLGVLLCLVVAIPAIIIRYAYYGPHEGVAFSDDWIPLVAFLALPFLSALVQPFWVKTYKNSFTPEAIKRMQPVVKYGYPFISILFLMCVMYFIAIKSQIETIFTYLILMMFIQLWMSMLELFRDQPNEYPSKNDEETKQG